VSSDYSRNALAAKEATSPRWRGRGAIVEHRKAVDAVSEENDGWARSIAFRFVWPSPRKDCERAILFEGEHCKQKQERQQQRKRAMN